MHVIGACKTTPGRIRISNEDNVFLDGIWIEEGSRAGQSHAAAEPSYHTFAVCDGMGGESFGEIASLLAVKTLGSYDGPDLGERFREYIETANRVICDEASRRLVNQMGAAIAVLSISGDRAAICNLGDCRIYRYDSKGLRQLSVDHRAEMPGLGKGMLTQHLGISEEEFVLEPYIVRDIPLESGMMFLMCSDGLTDMVPDTVLEGYLRESSGEKPAAIAGKLLQVAVEHGGRDNITALIVRINP